MITIGRLRSSRFTAQSIVPPPCRSDGRAQQPSRLRGDCSEGRELPSVANVEDDTAWRTKGAVGTLSGSLDKWVEGRGLTDATEKITGSSAASIQPDARALEPVKTER